MRIYAFVILLFLVVVGWNELSIAEVESDGECCLEADDSRQRVVLANYLPGIGLSNHGLGEQIA